MNEHQCEDCGYYEWGAHPKCRDCMRKLAKSGKCKHPDKWIRGDFTYIGDKLRRAGGYCMLCGLQHFYCVVQKLLLPKKKVKEFLKAQCPVCEKWHIDCKSA